MYKSVWWNSPVEYGAGLNPGQTWPTVMEQYRRPNDQRYYDLPTEEFSDKLYYEHPRLAKPVYRGKFRDHPWTVPSYYPSGIDNPPDGFHGQLYRETGRQFKYDGPPGNEQYWLQRPPYLPVFPRTPSYTATEPHGYGTMSFPKISSASLRANLSKPDTTWAQTGNNAPVTSSLSNTNNNNTDRFTIHHTKSSHELPQRRITQDGVGYL